MASYLLTDRAPDDGLFQGPDGVVTAAMFVRAAQALAADLPEAGFIVNLCQDRYRFAVVLAASILRRNICLLTSDRSENRLRALADRYPAAVAVSEESETLPMPHHRFADAASGAGGFDVDCIPADQLAAIVFTSGTTGEPVGNRKSWGALAERTRMAARRFGWIGPETTTIVGTVPPQHMYGFETTLLQPLHSTVASWHGMAFFPGDVREALCAVAAPRVLVTTPLQLRTLLAASVELPPLAQVISATAPLDVATALAAEARWGAPVLEIFGATEVGSVASRRTVTEEHWSVYPGVSFTRMATDAVMVEAAYAEPHPLGDAVAMVGPTDFRLLGRTADMIKLAGKRASLAGLNQILNAIEGVKDGVFVAPDDLDHRPAARLLAFVVAPDCSAEDILASLRRQIDPVFLPRRVVLVDALPRNEVGKLPRAAFSELAAKA